MNNIKAIEGLQAAGICLLGIILSFVLLAIFVEANFRFFNVQNEPSANLTAFVWRFDWIYIPLIVALVAVSVSVLNRGRRRLLLSLISVLPFIVFYLFAGSFSRRSMLFVVWYILIATAVSLVVGKIFAINSNQSQSNP
jgi:hypothetical protein